LDLFVHRVLLILAIGFAFFILPFVSPDRGVSPETLDFLEKALLGWGLILLPFLKVAQVYLKKHQHDKRRA
jgi:hypothetical protein